MNNDTSGLEEIVRKCMQAGSVLMRDAVLTRIDMLLKFRAPAMTVEEFAAELKKMIEEIKL